MKQKLSPHEFFVTKTFFSTHTIFRNVVARDDGFSHRFKRCFRRRAALAVHSKRITSQTRCDFCDRSRASEQRFEAKISTAGPFGRFLSGCVEEKFEPRALLLPFHIHDIKQ
jgi:hypothetical protein